MDLPAHEQRWDAGYFRQIGLAELADEDFVRIGQRIVDPSTPAARAFAPRRQEMGLRSVRRWRGMIDAHAGGIGTVGVWRGQQYGLCLRHFFLHHDHHSGSGIRPGRLGPLLFGDGAGLLAK